MAAFVKYNTFIEEIFEGGHNLGADSLKVALTNTAPTAATDTVWNTTVYPAPAAANGYTAGGNALTISSSAQTSGTYKQVLADSTFTATAGGIGPFRYAILYNTSKTNKVIGYYDYGSSITLSNVGDSFTVDFDPSTGAIQAS
jgi:hypothetical protein